MSFVLLIHILAAIVFLGNVLTTASWKAQADRTGNLHTIAYAHRQLRRMDGLFNGVGILTLIATGLVLTEMANIHLVRTGWLFVSFALLMVTSVIWLAMLRPTVRRLADMANAALASGALPDEFRKLSARWNMWNGLATLLPLVTLALMVLQPGGTVPAR